MTDRRRSSSRKQKAVASRGTHLPKQKLEKPRRIPRAEREAKRQRQLRAFIVASAALAIALLLGSAVYDYVVKPRQVVASVDGVRIRREDYWRYRGLELVNRASQYSQFVQYVQDPQQQQQYQQLANQALQELDGLWGSTEIDNTTLQNMIEDQVYLQSLDDLGIVITEGEIDDYVEGQFAPADAPLQTATPTPTLIPERAAWATETVVALLTPTTDPFASPAASPVGGSPQASPVVGSPQASPAGSPQASPETSPASSPEASPASSPEASPASSPEASPAASPAASPIVGSPEASPILPSPTATLTLDEARGTAIANFGQYEDNILEAAHMSRADYERLYARPQLARQRVREALTADVGQSAEQVHASHILVSTRELADQIYADVTTGGLDFATVAREKSTDTGTAANGGDLGWFTRGVMVAPFEDVAFATAAGQIAPPVQTEFGWHVILVIEADPDRAMSDDQIQRYKDTIVNRWLEERLAASNIDSDIPPTPTPMTNTFVPPPDAPTPPLPTEIPVASPVASPNASPAASPVGSPPAATMTPTT